MARRFERGASQEERALQIWQILISKADNSQTITYADLGRKMGFREPAVVRQGLLLPVARYCEINNLPDLTILVVGEHTGVPGREVPEGFDPNTERQRVFRESWYQVVPPTLEELRQAIQNE